MVFVDSNKRLTIKLAGSPLQIIAELSTAMSSLFDSAPDVHAKELLKDMLHRAVDNAFLDDDALEEKIKERKKEMEKEINDDIFAKIIREMGYKEED